MDAKSDKKQFFDAGGGKTKSNAIQVPSISLPKGGGAIRFRWPTHILRYSSLSSIQVGWR